MRASSSECHAQIHQQRPARGTSFRRLARHLLQRVVDGVRLLHRGAQRSQCATKCTQPIAPRIRPEDRHDQHGAAIFARQSPTPAPRAPGPAVDDVPGAQNVTPPGSEPSPTSATMCAHRRASATRRSTSSAQRAAHLFGGWRGTCYSAWWMEFDSCTVARSAHNAPQSVHSRSPHASAQKIDTTSTAPPSLLSRAPHLRAIAPCWAAKKQCM